MIFIVVVRRKPAAILVGRIPSFLVLEQGSGIRCPSIIGSAGQARKTWFVRVSKPDRGRAWGIGHGDDGFSLASVERTAYKTKVLVASTKWSCPDDGKDHRNLDRKIL